MKLSSKELNERAHFNYEIHRNFFNIQEESWRMAVLELALENLGIDPSKLLEENPEEVCCGKEEGSFPEDHKELDCWCCNGSCVWCN